MRAPSVATLGSAVEPKAEPPEAEPLVTQRPAHTPAVPEHVEHACLAPVAPPGAIGQDVDGQQIRLSRELLEEGTEHIQEKRPVLQLHHSLKHLAVAAAMLLPPLAQVLVLQHALQDDRLLAENS